ncbi:MAG: hypothetical protein WBQ44_11380 [Rhodococcus sp. (in: high G+C Gram-positive bacteria)]
MTPSDVTYKASAMDMLRSESRIICALGPADFGGIERVRERLQRLASAGPAARVGLRVDSTSPKWAYAPKSVTAHVQTVATITKADLVQRLVQLAETVTLDVSLRAHLAGEYLLLDISHGFSDSVLPIELMAFLADPATHPELPAWATAKAVRNPLPRALATWMLHNPRKVADVLYGKFRPAPRTRTVPEPPQIPVVPWTRSPAVAVATSAVGAPSAMRNWRKANSPDVTVTSILCAAIATALSEQGIRISQSVDFLFDCRRYLRTDGVVLGNFAVGISFEAVDPTSATELNAVVGHAIDKGRPLAAGAIGAFHYFRTRSALPASATTTAPATAVAELVFSDVGRIPQLEAIAWTGAPDECAFHPLSEPSYSDTIVITSLQIRDTFHVSASFHDNVFDRLAVQSALELVMSDPIALLDPTASLSLQELSR